MSLEFDNIHDISFSRSFIFMSHRSVGKFNCDVYGEDIIVGELQKFRFFINFANLDNGKHKTQLTLVSFWFQ